MSCLLEVACCLLLVAHRQITINGQLRYEETVALYPETN